MIYEVGTILLVRDYQLPTKVKDKFFIVIGLIDNQLMIMSMTTSQVYFNPALIKAGVIKERDMSIYCFLKDCVIGQNGFAFHKNTFVSHRSNVLPFSFEKMASLNIEYLDCLTKEETINLIYSFYTYIGTSKRYKKLFEKILEKLSE
ncbi:MAG: hypothetical protein LBO74_09015 [Candidatus Symbiothrix sp.]|jgi:hypothetical protein|nr:hypothetical protein [Candidatus Symbiothrix sp.]